MSASIFFRFKSQKDPIAITFDGASLSVFEVKREIIAISKLGDGTDFDLDIFTPESERKSFLSVAPHVHKLTPAGYDDDTTQIPRSTTVIARRHPASKPGAGRAARYVTGKMPVTAKNQHRIESTPVINPNKGAGPTFGAPGGKELTEEEKLDAMFDANNEAWKQSQAQMGDKPFVRNTYNKAVPAPDKPLPPGYTCHRCGEKGHWIQVCPTNNDPNFDGRPKFRRTTGIPRSMLKLIEKPTEVDENGKIDVSKLPPGVMYTANGEWVIAEPDKAAWNKFQEKQNASAEKAKEASAEDQEVEARGLACPVDKRMFVEPVKTPCCHTTYCRECIENALLDADLICPNCSEQVLLDGLEDDAEMIGKTKAYQDEKKSRKERESKSPAAASNRDASPSAAKSPAPGNGLETGINGTKSPASTPNGKKRAAEDELQNNHKPARPAEMNQSGAKPIPTGPKAKTPQVMPIANNVQDFAKQMNAMSSSMGGMQGGMPAMMNPMMNPMAMGMGMGMAGYNPMMGVGMPGYGMNGANGMGMNGMGWNGQGMQNGGWQGQQQRQQGWGGNRGGGQQGGNGGAYMRQPVNPGRGQGKQKRQRSVDYKQM